MSGTKRPMSIEKQLLNEVKQESVKQQEPQPKRLKEENTLVLDPSGTFNDKPYWSLDSKKRASVSEFKKKLLIDLREYHNGIYFLYPLHPHIDGPTRKGISLSIEAYEKFKSLIPTIDAEIEKNK